MTDTLRFVDGGDLDVASTIDCQAGGVNSEIMSTRLGTESSEPLDLLSGEDGLAEAVARRRNFAIISHPDAGKTTLTEKLLLYGGAIQQAGAVKARGEQRKVTSDWMELEKQRGISITSTVLQFDYSGSTINLLDTRAACIKWII